MLKLNLEPLYHVEKIWHETDCTERVTPIMFGQLLK